MVASHLQFELEAVADGSRARAARFRTAHNEVLTPLFMPVGTFASVKAQLPGALVASGSQILLANTYHLLLRPGIEVFERFGGIHRFMGWDRSVLTDSGGYQIFSLPHSREITEEGAVFKSYIDGRTILLSPELSIQTQRAIRSDIMMALDQCVPALCTEVEARAAVAVTQRWAVRSLAARGDSPQALFGIVQGALFPERRRESAAGLTQLPFDGFAIGGLAVGEETDQRQDMTELSAALLPADRPRYLMGVGSPLDVLEAVHRGVDMFDCIIPTKLAQQGVVYTSRGIVSLRRAVYQLAEEPVDAECACPTCRTYSRAYLHHLTKTEEPVGWQLLGQHNIWFYHQLMRDIRQSIFDGTFLALYAAKRQVLDVDDRDNPTVAPKVRARRIRPTTLGDYTLFTAMEGFSSIRHVSSGEIMHAHTPPMEEARCLYVEQSALGERLRLRPGEDAASARPLVIWDVGLGAAANAIAAILCYEDEAARGPVRELQIVSFENDLDSLRLALAHKDRFPYLRHGAADAILHRGEWKSRRVPGISWSLIEGDFFTELTRPTSPPDLVFYDLYSSRTLGQAWAVSTFRALFAAIGDHPAELITYSTSTRVRVALLAAGFYVAHGQSAGEKKETTVALAPGFAAPCRYRLLGDAWLGRWSRSDVRFPEDLPVADQVAFEAMIRRHPQFAGTSGRNDAPATPLLTPPDVDPKIIV